MPYKSQKKDREWHRECMKRRRSELCFWLKLEGGEMSEQQKSSEEAGLEMFKELRKGVSPDLQALSICELEKLASEGRLLDPSRKTRVTPDKMGYERVQKLRDQYPQPLAIDDPATYEYEDNP